MRWRQETGNRRPETGLQYMKYNLTIEQFGNLKDKQ